MTSPRARAKTYEQLRREREEAELLARYREATGGREPGRLPDDDPLAHQWEYTGTRAERDALADELGFADREPPPVIDGQETLL